MIEFQVDDMTCGHCSRAIEKAIAAIDPGARVAVDLDHKRVSISNTRTPAPVLAAALAQEGYPALPVGPSAGPQAQPARSCCGASRCH